LKVRSPFRRRLVRWRKAATSTTTRVMTICVAFGALMLTGVYAGKDNFALFRSVEVSGADGAAGGTSEGDAAAKANRVVGHDELNPRDPVMRFADTGVGHMLFASTRSDQCRRLLFDNRTGAYYEAPDIFCGQKPEEGGDPVPHDRVSAMRKAFKR
jgi:hypothetical protein